VRTTHLSLYVNQARERKPENGYKTPDDSEYKQVRFPDNPERLSRILVEAGK